jgi:hypothetical protein
LSAPNTEPLFSKRANIDWVGAMTAANNAKDITGNTVYCVWTADPTNGGYLEEVRVKADPVNNTAATVCRLYINNGSTIATPANSTFVTEISIPAVTASATAAQPDFVIPVGKVFDPGFKAYLSFGTAPGGSGQFSGTGFGGDY